MKAFFCFCFLGTFAVISILVSKPTIEHCAGDPNLNGTLSNVTFSNETFGFQDIRCEMKVAVALTFLSGIIQVKFFLSGIGLRGEYDRSGVSHSGSAHCQTTQDVCMGLLIKIVCYL